MMDDWTQKKLVHTAVGYIQDDKLIINKKIIFIIISVNKAALVSTIILL